jgi:signal transduction histidine kinase
MVKEVIRSQCGISSMVREILVAHGGGVTVESVEGQGTTFVLTFPAPG